jgi:hypothetical protein
MNLFNAEFDLIDKSTEAHLKASIAALASLLILTGTVLYLHASSLLG